MPKIRTKPRKPLTPGAKFLAFLEREKPALKRIAAGVAKVERFQLRRVRQALNLDQKELARSCGMTQQGLSHVEYRENAEAVTIRKLRKVARAMGFEVVYFLIRNPKGPRLPGQ